MKLWEIVKTEIEKIERGEAGGFYKGKVQPFMYTFGAPLSLALLIILVISHC